MQSLVVGFAVVINFRVNDLSLENKVLALSWKLYVYVLQPNYQPNNQLMYMDL